MSLLYLLQVGDEQIKAVQISLADQQVEIYIFTRVAQLGGFKYHWRMVREADAEFFKILKIDGND